MSGVSDGNQDVDIDLAALFRAIWRRRIIVASATVGMAALAFVGASLISPSYQSETRLLIEARSPNFSTQTGSGNGEPVFDELDIASQVQLLRSVDLIKQVAREFKLYERKEFDPDASPSLVSELLVLLHLKKNPLDLAPEERVLKAFDEKLQVYQVEKSRVIGVQFTSKDPKLSAAIPNKMVEIYMSLQSGAKLDSNSEAARWLEPEIANLREKVRDAERKVADYRNASGLFATGETTNLPARQLNDISTELARVRGEKADAEAKSKNVRAALKAGRPTENLDAVRSAPAVQTLKDAETNLRRQISQLSTALLEGHPQMKALRAQLDAVRGQIDAEAARIAASLDDAAEVARLRETQLMQQLNALKADSAQANEDEVGLKDLEREAAAQRQLLETYLARYREATTRLEKGASPADARIISNAVEPREPQFPKVGVITIVAALATFILSSVIIMLLELFSGRALRPVERSPAQAAFGAARQAAAPSPPPVGKPIETVVDPLRAARPGNARAKAPEAKAAEQSATEQRAPAERAPRETAAEGRQVATEPAGPATKSEMRRKSAPASLLSAPSPEEPPLPEATAADEDEDEFSVSAVAAYLAASQMRVAIAISPSGDDGSTATVMLARRLAEEGRTTVLIDMTGSACPTRLMASRRDLPGVTDLLCGEADFAEAIHVDRLSEAHIVPQGTADIRRAMRGVERLGLIADALSEVYDLVIIECGPADAQGVARMSRAGEHEIILSAPDPDREELMAIMQSFEAVGYDDVLLMSEPALAGQGPHGRRAA